MLLVKTVGEDPVGLSVGFLKSSRLWDEKSARDVTEDLQASIVPASDHPPDSHGPLRYDIATYAALCLCTLPPDASHN